MRSPFIMAMLIAGCGWVKGMIFKELTNQVTVLWLPVTAKLTIREITFSMECT